MNFGGIGVPGQTNLKSSDRWLHEGRYKTTYFVPWDRNHGMLISQ